MISSERADILENPTILLCNSNVFCFHCSILQGHVVSISNKGGKKGRKRDSKAMEIHFFFFFSSIYLNTSTGSIREIVPSSFKILPYLLYKMRYGRYLWACIRTGLLYKRKCVGPHSPFFITSSEVYDVVGRGRLSNLWLTGHYICAFLFPTLCFFSGCRELWEAVSPMPFSMAIECGVFWLFCSKYIKLYLNPELTLSLIRIDSLLIYAFIYFILSVAIVPLL